MPVNIEFEFPETAFIEPPRNSKALCLYLLIKAGLKGMDNYEAVVHGRNWKFNTRLSELINKHGLQVHKKDEKGNNQFGHPYTSKRYCLYEGEKDKNLDLYKRINQ